MRNNSLFLWLFLLSCPIYGAQIFLGEKQTVALGSGIDSMTNQFRSPCLDGTVAPSNSNRTLSFKMYAGQSAGEILEDQRGYGSAQVDFWVLGAKAKSEFILRNSESKTQSSLIWSVEYRSGTQVFENRQLNAKGRMAANQTVAERQALCGNQFVWGQVTGARFYLAASLLFESQEKYQYYKTKVSASALGGLLKKDKTSTAELLEIAKGAHLSIQVFQNGGQTFDLDLIAATQVSYCPIEQVQACQDRFSALYQYAFGPTGLRTHLDTGRWQDQAILWILGSDYADAGHYSLAAEPLQSRDSGFVLLSEQLFRWNATLQQKIAEVSARYWDGTKNSNERDSEKQRMEQVLQASLLLKNTADSCMNDESDQVCQNRLNEIENKIGSP